MTLEFLPPQNITLLINFLLTLNHLYLFLSEAIFNVVCEMLPCVSESDLDLYQIPLNHTNVRKQSISVKRTNDSVHFYMTITYFCYIVSAA